MWRGVRMDEVREGGGGDVWRGRKWDAGLEGGQNGGLRWGNDC